MRDENNELPGHFLGELYKWALECKRQIAHAEFELENCNGIHLDCFFFRLVFHSRWTCCTRHAIGLRQPRGQ